MEVITSTQNPKIKHLLALQEKSSERRKSGLFVVEGRRELQHCIEAGFQIDSVFVKDPPLTPPVKEGIVTYAVSCHVYERIAYRGSTEGIIAIVRSAVSRSVMP